MKTWRIVAVFLALILCGAFLSGCTVKDDMASRHDIFSYVNANHGLLEAFPYTEIPGEPKQRKAFIKNYLGKKTIVKHVFGYDENVLWFHCGGSGSVNNNYTASGFYYSKYDIPVGGQEYYLYEVIEVEPGIFECQGEDGHRTFRTEKIRDNWYYYWEDYFRYFHYEDNTN